MYTFSSIKEQLVFQNFLKVVVRNFMVVLQTFFCYWKLLKEKNTQFPGACHAEELQYLFPIAKELFVSASPTQNDLKVREIMLSLWVNFAKTRWIFF